MSYDPYNTYDPRNMIRKCPRCNEVWIKVEGCDGKTTCGNRNWDNGGLDIAQTETFGNQF